MPLATCDWAATILSPRNEADGEGNIIKKLILAGTVALIATSAFARGGGGGHGGSHSISGYFRSSGTYVRPSGATNPNRTQFDNYSTKGNVNPYSGAVGTKTPK